VTQQIPAVSRDLLLGKIGGIARARLVRVGGRDPSPTAANDQLPPAKTAPTELLSFVLADLVRSLARAERILNTRRLTSTLAVKPTRPL